MRLLRAFIPVPIRFTAVLLVIFVNKPVLAQEGFFERNKLTGDWGGLRKQLEDAGITLGITDVSETLSNPTGGIRQLSIYQGLLDASLNLDLDKLLAWPGATFYTDGYWISGEGLSRNAIGNLLAVSSIEALASTRLHDMWLQKQFLDQQASIRIGQIAIDDEFTSANTRRALSTRPLGVRTFCRRTCRAGGRATRLRCPARGCGRRRQAI